MKSKLLAGILSLNLLFTTDAVSNFITHARANSENLCEHHTEHGDDCSYVEGEIPCDFDCEICNSQQETSGTVEQSNSISEPTSTKEATTIDYTFEGDVFYMNDNGTWEVNPTASQEEPLTKEQLLQELPQNIILNTDEQQTIPVTWNLDTYGESQYTGEYYLTANIAEDIEVPEGFSREIRVLVAFDSPSLETDTVIFEFVEFGSDGDELSQDSEDRYILRGINENGETYFYVNPEKLKDYSKDNPMNCDDFLNLLPKTVKAYDTRGNEITGLKYNHWAWNKHANIKTAYKGEHVLLYYFNKKVKTSGSKVEQEESQQIQVVLDFPYEIENKSQYQVESLSPSNVQVNLYDYWIRDSYSSDGTHDNVAGTAAETNKKPYYFLRGINEASNGTYHPLIFAGIAYNRKPDFFGDGYNTYTRYTVGGGVADEKNKGQYAYTGIVKNRLDSDGYPVLNLTKEQVDNTFENSIANNYMTANEKGNEQESLGYLFNEDTDSQGGKAVYSDVSGLFQLDKDGYYYYDSTQNFAEYDEEENQFNLYNTTFPSSSGQFFPFNSVEDLFDETDSGELQAYKNRGDTTVNTLEPVHHYFGLSMTVQFQQPIGGMLTTENTTKPMQFTYSGDDDIWIYIDGVLVSDLGGIHDALSTTIDFSTGRVTNTSKNTDKVEYKTLKELFTEAGEFDEQEFDGDTFLNYSEHELKVFYLERGNTASNLKLEFNLMEPQSGGIIKVDQDGNALNDVEFDLYEADDSYNILGNPISHYKTGSIGIDGYSYFYDKNGKPLAFDSNKRYVLKEVKTAEGFVTTGDIHLKYNENTGILEAVNKWETGAVSSFEAQIYQAGNLIYNGGTEVGDEGKKGLIIAVPQFFTGDYEKGDRTDQTLWKPMYGSVTDGFELVEDSQNSTGDMNEDSRTLSLQAAANQILDNSTEYWHLEYSENSGRYYANLIDLPGSLDRYYTTENTKGVFMVAYYLLDTSDISGKTDILSGKKTSSEKYAAIDKIIAEEYNNDVSKFAEDYQTGFKLLDISNFNRLYYTRLYIPNQVRELSVLKQNDSGEPLSDAEFTLYSDADCKNEIAKGITDDNGRVRFSSQPKSDGNTADVYVPLARKQDENGVKQDTYYYLKETKAPSGYDLNNTVIKVLVTKDSIYVDAGTTDDDISVRKGVSRLLQTVTRYAASEDIDLTLRDLQMKFYTIPSSENPSSKPFSKDTWTDTGQLRNLHYGINTSEGFEFGIHENNLTPYYEVNEGWLGFSITQNYTAHNDPNADDPYYTHSKNDDLSNMELSQLTTASTTVVVTDKKVGQIAVKKVAKTEDGANDQYLKGAIFKLEKLVENEGEPSKWLLDETFKAQELTTDGKGDILYSNLSYGTYKLTEIQAPTGYVLLKNPIYITLSEEVFDLQESEHSDDLSYDKKEKKITVTVVNEKALTMPLTGGNGRDVLMYAIVGFALIGVATLMYKKREEKNT